MNTAVGKSRLIMGGTDYGNEAPSHGIFDAAAGDSGGEISCHQGTLRGHPALKPDVWGPLPPAFPLFLSPP